MHYLSEFRVNWRPLVAATLGLGVGGALAYYTSSLFAPPLLEEFGWDRATFALVGVAPILTFLCVPFAGRLTDMFGVRRVALIGVISLPLTFVAASMMQGEILHFFAIVMVQQILGSTTTSAVYTRLAAEPFKRARGLALSCVMTGPPLVGAVGVPLLAGVIDAHGWRAGYQTLAVVSAVLGVLVLLLAESRTARAASEQKPPARSAAGDYKLISRSAVFWILLLGMLLCNIAGALPNYQLKLLLLDNGASSQAATMMLSGYAFGVIIGRFCCGFALDRLPTHLVATIGMGLPSIGMLILASPLDATAALAVGVALIGLSQGAEGDVAAYLVARYFDMEIYGSVVGLLLAVISGATALGALVLSFTIAFSGGYTLFLCISAALILLGSASFMLLSGRAAPHGSASQSAVAP